jgi:hypothetical protein
MKLDKFCQSCHIPKNHNLFENGTESDGAENADYCKMCYEKGIFTMQDTIATAEDMKLFVKDVLKTQGVGKVKRWFYTIGIPRLKRWNKT